jgi:hypothetical protein
LSAEQSLPKLELDALGFKPVRIFNICLSILPTVKKVGQKRFTWDTWWSNFFCSMTQAVIAVHATH